MAERTVPSTQRSAYLASLEARRATCAAHGVQFWVFEHEHTAGRFVEFAESRDASQLERAWGAIGALPASAPAAHESRWRSVEIA
jgi:hypothetical protein